jgi:carboxypeptidase PM20D1
MIKKTLLSLVAVAIVLAAVLSIRAARMPSLQGEEESAVRVPIDTMAVAERLAGAIRIPTVSHERVEDTDTAAFLALHDYLARTYPRVHERLTRETVSDLSLLYTWEGSDPSLEPIVLMGHQDVVPVIPGTEGDWTHAPFGGEIADGAVWGRGTLDDKINVVSVLESVEALLADGFQPRRTIYLAFGHDEERGGTRGAKAIAGLLGSRGAEPYALVLDEGGGMTRGMLPGLDATVAIVGIAEKGYVNLELRVDGVGGHSSAPPKQTNIGILADAIGELEEHPFPARLQGGSLAMVRHVAPEMPFAYRLVLGNLWLFRPLVTRVMTASQESAPMVRTTTAATIVEGGVKANVLPITARAVVNFRILPGETKESVLARVRGVIADDRVQVSIYGDDAVDPSSVSEPDGPAFRLLARTLRQVTAGERVVVTPYLVTAGTDAKYYSGRSPGVLRFLAATLGGDAMSQIHGTDEHIPLPALATSVAFLQQLIRNSDEM